MPRCTICGENKISINSLKLHLIIVHTNYDDSFKCKEANCYRSFKGWKQFRRHLIIVHKVNPSDTATLSQGPEKFSVDVDGPSNLEYAPSTPDDGDVLETSEASEVPSLTEIENHVRSLALTLVCKLYANPKLPRNHVQEVLGDVGELVDDILTTIRPCFQIKNDTRDYESCFDKVQNAVMKPFRNTLSTEYRRRKAIEQTKHLIKARDYVVGDSLDNVLHENRVIQDRSSVTAEFIPIREVLTQFFSLPEVMCKTLEYLTYLEAEKKTGIYSNFVQGKLWEEKLKEFKDKFVLPIFIYYDDFEINNPLGSHAGVNKLGGVYFSIPCLPPEYRSRVENIFTAALFNSNDRKTSPEGNDAIFNILVDELNFLSREGIELNIDGEAKKVYFSLALLLGDNEALNSAAGFMEGPNANIYCRFCKMPKHQSQQNCPLRDELIRTREQYETDGFHQQKQTGVKENSIWNLVEYFHVVQNFFSDIAHDLLEGVCRYVMQHTLHYLICGHTKTLNLDRLNAKMKSFNYEKNGFSNKPPLLRYDEVNQKKLSMSESEMHAFILVFPMLVEDLIEGGIDMEQEIWQLFSLLRQIMDICFAKSLRRDMIGVFDSLVNQHHNLYMKLFNDTLKPKFHNMKHYSQIMRMSGPLSHLSLLRYESKHRELKYIASSTTSRKNPCHTIAVKEQLRLCYRLIGKRGLTSEFELGDGDSLDSITLGLQLTEFQESVPDNFSGPCLDVAWVQINGTKYKVGSIIAIDIDSEGFVEFGKILYIFANEEERVLFACEKIIVKSFIEELHAYEVVNSYEKTCCLAENLISPYLAIHHCLNDGRDILSLRHAL